MSETFILLTYLQSLIQFKNNNLKNINFISVFIGLAQFKNNYGRNILINIFKS